jgi:hypothetical protein
LENASDCQLRVRKQKLTALSCEILEAFPVGRWLCEGTSRPCCGHTAIEHLAHRAWSPNCPTENTFQHRMSSKYMTH